MPRRAAGSDHEDPAPQTGEPSAATVRDRARRPNASPPRPARRATSPSRAASPAPSLDAGLFRRIAERSHDLAYRYAILPVRRFEYVSPAATALTSYTPEEHYADPDLAFRLVHPDDRPVLEAAMRGEARDPVVVRWIRRDGSLIWTEHHHVAVLDDAGALLAVEGTARDVTVRERAREAVDLSERRLRALLERVGLLAGSVDLDGRITFANAALLELSGWTGRDVVGRDWFGTFVPASSREAMRAAFRADVATERVERDVVTELLVRNGPPRRALLHVLGVHDAAGNLAGVAMVGEDLTDADERATLAARLTAAIGQTADAVVITDADGRIEYVNPAFERVSGYALAEVAGENPRILRSGRQPASFYRRMWRTLVDGATWSGELINRRKDGGLFVEEATITPIRDPQGVVTAYVGVKRDVTRLRELREALDRSRHQREEVARSIAGLAPGPTLEVTAERIASVLLAIPGADVGAVVAFENGARARLLALATELDVALVVGEPLPPARSAYLRERAAQGSWVERWRTRPEDGEYDRALGAAGIRATLFVPVDDGTGPLGVLLVAVGRGGSAARLTEQLPSAVEVAAVARTLLAPLVEARAAVQAAEARVGEIVAVRAFHPVYQPIVDLETGIAIGFEALTRFADGSRPDLVFRQAHLAGQVVELEAVTLEAAVAGAAALPIDAWLSLNVSPALVLADGRLAELLAHRNRPVVLEITEHEQVDDYDALRSALVALGPDVRVAVDDAGAGIANFAHLVELRPAFVKVDMGLVRGVNADVSRQAVVVGLRHFARAAGAGIIAEGIETEAERAVLRRLDVELGQGYLFGRPAPADAWTRGTSR